VEAKDLFEEVGLGVHGEALDSSIGQAGKADAEFSGVALDFHVLDALDVGALKCISHAEEGSELADADAVLRAECSVAWVIQAGAGMAVVAGDEGDQGDVEAVEPEDFRVEDEVFGMFVMGAGADVGPDFVKDGGDLEEQSVVGSELMEIAEGVEEAGAKVSDMFAVAGVGLVAFCENSFNAIMDARTNLSHNAAPLLTVEALMCTLAR
jgi:hypothetical protein